jgi:hypothetical protein
MTTDADKAFQYSKWLASGMAGVPSDYSTISQTLYGARNPGGGIYDTIIGEETPRREVVPGGDVITSGPKSTRVDTNTLRARYMIAGYDDVKSGELGDAQSNALFETFSWVPDGYGLGPKNRLHMLNKQHDLIRFGTEMLYQPRMYEEQNIPHAEQEMWQNELPIRTIDRSFADMLDVVQSQKIAESITRNTPMMVHDPDEWNVDASSKGLHRRNVQTTKPIVQVHPALYNRDQPCSAQGGVPTEREMLRATWTNIR